MSKNKEKERKFQWNLFEVKKMYNFIISDWVQKKDRAIFKSVACL